MPSLEDAENMLRSYALSLPEAWEDHPWGETAIKVRKKVFLFMGRPDVRASRRFKSRVVTGAVVID